MSTLQAPFRLLDLPPELIGAVCDYLPDEELKHIRSVCSYLRDHSTPAFGQRFFDHLIVILHPVSLIVLLDIARHEQLSKYVRQVSVSGKCSQDAKWQVLGDKVKEAILQSEILSEAFLLMRNLRVLRVDPQQYSWRSCWGVLFPSLNREMRPGVACGSKQIRAEDRFPLVNCWYCSVYRLVLDVLERVHRSEIDLEMSFEPWADDSDDSETDSETDSEMSFVESLDNPYDSEGATRFDIQSPLWRDQGSGRVRHLSFREEEDSTWAYDLLKSVTNLHSLHIYVFMLKKMTFFEFQTCFKWPHLARINLINLTTTHEGFLEFLEVHQNSLEDIFLSRIEFVQGTWSAPLMILSRMPKLKSLSLDFLLEQDLYSDPDKSNNQLPSRHERLSVTGVRRVASTIMAICERMIAIPIEGSRE